MLSAFDPLLLVVTQIDTQALPDFARTTPNSLIGLVAERDSNPWHDVKFSLRHLQNFSRVAVVTNPDVHHLWSSLVAPFMRCDVEHFSPGEIEAARDWRMWPAVGA